MFCFCLYIFSVGEFVIRIYFVRIQMAIDNFNRILQICAFVFFFPVTLSFSLLQSASFLQQEFTLSFAYKLGEKKKPLKVATTKKVEKKMQKICLD